MAYAASKGRSAPLQKEILTLLSQLDSVSVKELCYFTGASMATVRRLEQLGYLRLDLRPVLPEPPAAPAAGTASPFVALFAEAVKKAFVGGTEATGQTAPADSAASPIGALISEAIKKSIGGAAAPSAPASAPAGEVNTEEVVDK